MKIEITNVTAKALTHTELVDGGLRSAVEQYFEKMDTVPTREWCTCPWIIHPDDHNVEEGKRRMRRADDDEMCPLHSRKGMLLYFFTWVSTAAASGDRSLITRGSETV